MSDIEFVNDLPENGRVFNSRLHRQMMADFAAAAKANPGRWAVWPYPSTYAAARAVASRISLGKIAAFGDGYDAVCNQGTVYVRYVGEQ